MSEKQNMGEKQKERLRETEKNEREKRRLESVIEGKLEGKIERKRNFYAKASDVKRAMHLNQPMIILMYKEALNANPVDSPLSISISSLLQEFDDVIPEELPHGLPPIRGIEHQIDLVLGATIPNQPD